MTEKTDSAFAFGYQNYTHHELLGVDLSASSEEVHDAYQSLVRNIAEHYGNSPRRKLSDAARVAHATLSDARSRREYELWLNTNPEFLLEHECDPFGSPRKFQLEPLPPLPVPSAHMDPNSMVDPTLLPPEARGVGLPPERIFSSRHRKSPLAIYGLFAVLPLLVLLSILSWSAGLWIASVYTAVLITSYARATWGSSTSGTGLIVWSSIGLLSALIVAGAVATGDKSLHSALGPFNWLAIVVIASLFPASRSVIKAKKSSSAPLLPKSLSKVRAWGAPGRGPDVPGASPQENADIREAELRTARALDHLLQVPGVRIFHGVRYRVGGEYINFGHAVVYGHRVVFIDSKMWAGAYYGFKGKRVVADRGAPDERDFSDFYGAIRKVRSEVRMNARGMVAIHSSDAGVPMVGIENFTGGTVEVVNPHTMVHRLIEGMLMNKSDLSTVERDVLLYHYHRLFHPVPYADPK